MLLKILGWFWVITGLIFLLKPLWLKNKLQKQSVKKVRRFCFWTALVLGLLLIKAGWGIPGILAKVVIVCGVIAIFKAVFLLKSKAADHIVDWFMMQPVKMFRLFAVLQIIFGAIILSV